MFREKKGIVLVLTILVLFYILVSPNILPNVTLGYKDAFIISFFVGLVTLGLRYLSRVETIRLEKKLLRQHSQLAAILNNSPFIVFLKSVDGKIILANEVLADLFSTKRNLLIGKNSYDFVVNPEKCKEEDEQLLRNKEIITCERFEKLTNGEEHWFRVVKVPVLDSSNNVSSIVVIFRIIDDVKEIETRKNTFIATLTHDLKTPTIAQIRALDLLLGEIFGKISEDQREMLFQIKSSCKYMYDLIFTILDTYLYDNGLTKVNLETFDVLNLINETIKGMTNLLVERGQTLSINNKLSTNTLKADKVQIKRVIINLIANAITHGFTNSTIEILLEERGENFKFEVKNQSEYINEAQMKDIFEKYKHVENSKSFKTSTGLGLYLSKQIIDAHQGKLYACSNKDKTCCFGFEIPKNIVVANDEEFANS